MITKETAYEKITSLVERFGEQYASYKNAAYNETMVRRDFIDPFFKALGWDIDNEQGFAEAFREVIHEERIKRMVYQLYGLTEEEIRIVESKL